MIFNRKGRDIQKFFESLSFVKAGKSGYTKTDRYRDFRQTFNTDAGKRVLAQIIDECEGLPILENEVSDTHKVAYRAGKRSAALWIIQVLNAEPLNQE